jgi:phospholipase/carboxylesterase
MGNEEAPLESFCIAQENPTSIMLLLHGYGTSSDDLLPIGLSLKTLLPTAVVVFANAPTPCEKGFGYQWFSLRTMNLFSILKEIKKAHVLLDKFIDSQLEKYNLQDDALILGGFSQGAMMTLYTGVRRLQKPKCLLSFSGMMPDTIETLSREIRAKPNTCLIHGTMDTVVPFSSMEQAEELLRELEIPFESYAIEDMEHEINDEALDSAKEFLQNILNAY